MKKPLTIVVLGRSGSGKGVQIERLIKKLKPIIAIHTGARFRALAKAKTPAGHAARLTVLKGFLAPSWLASHMWIDALMKEYDPKKNIIFDGSPRMLEEAKLVDNVLSWFHRKDLIALYIDVSEKEVTKRLLLRKRSDDEMEAIKNRLAFFKKHVVPVINYYKKTKRLIRINGEQTIDEVFVDIKKVLKLK